MRGLRGRESLDPGHALLLKTRSVHTFGMRFPIDAVLLDGTGTVIDVRRMDPGKLLLPRRRVRHILEMAAGTALRRGDVLRWG